MAIYKVDGRVPQVGAAAFVADNATLAGDVTLAEESSVWYGAVLRADTARITIGAGSNVQDNAVLHTGPGLDVVVGRNGKAGALPAELHPHMQGLGTPLCCFKDTVSSILKIEQKLLS